MSEDHSTPPKNEPDAESNVSPELLKAADEGVKTFEHLSKGPLNHSVDFAFIAEAAQRDLSGLSEQLRRAAPQIAKAKAAIKELANVEFGITGNGDDDDGDSR